MMSRKIMASAVAATIAVGAGIVVGTPASAARSTNYSATCDYVSSKKVWNQDTIKIVVSNLPAGSQSWSYSLTHAWDSGVTTGTVYRGSRETFTIGGHPGGLTVTANPSGARVFVACYQAR